MDTQEVEFKRVIGKGRRLKYSAPVPVAVESFPEESEFPEDETPVPVTAEVVPISQGGENTPETMALSMPKAAMLIIVNDQASLAKAEQNRLRIKDLIAYFNGKYDGRISASNALHKGLLKDKKGYTDPLEEAERIINRQKIAPYLAAEETKRKEAERLRAEVEFVARQEAEKAVKKSNSLETEGKFDQAAAVVDKAAVKVDQILSRAPVVPKVETNLSLRKEWKFSIINPAAVPAEYLVPDEKKIGRVVRAANGNISIPGVRIWSEDRIQ